MKRRITARGRQPSCSFQFHLSPGSPPAEGGPFCLGRVTETVCSSLASWAAPWPELCGSWFNPVGEKSRLARRPLRTAAGPTSVSSVHAAATSLKLHHRPKLDVFLGRARQYCEYKKTEPKTNRPEITEPLRMSQKLKFFRRISIVDQRHV